MRRRECIRYAPAMMRAMITVVFFGSSGPRKGRGVYKRDVAETKTNYAQQSTGKRALVESFFRSGGVWEGAVGTNGHGVERMKESRARGPRGGASNEAFLWLQNYQGPRGAHMRRASKSMKGVCVRRAGDAAPRGCVFFSLA